MKKIKKSDLEIKPRVISQLNDTPNPNEEGSVYPCNTLILDGCDGYTDKWAPCASNNECPSKNCSKGLGCNVSEDCVDSESHAPLCCPQSYGEDDCPKPESDGCQDTRVCLYTQPPMCEIPASAEEDTCQTGTCETVCMVCGDYTMKEETCIEQSI